MVCPRCIAAVETLLRDTNLPYEKVALGQATLSRPLTPEETSSLSVKLPSLGFELLEENNSRLISRLKGLIVEQVHHSKEPLQVNFSTYLSEKLNHEYSYLSRLFSSVEGITIEKYITRQKIERVKELLFYDEMSLTEIAGQMNYSSTAYLSTQFKKETGMTPSEFKKLQSPGHRHLDSL